MPHLCILRNVTCQTLIDVNEWIKPYITNWKANIERVSKCLNEVKINLTQHLYPYIFYIQKSSHINTGNIKIEVVIKRIVTKKLNKF